MVTGANRGIGKATALGLARMNATVVLVCRDQSRGEAALAEIKAKSHNSAIDLLIADLASQTSIRQLVLDFQARYPQLHVLINNAAIFRSKRTVTPDGVETCFAVNYLASFMLTNLLLDSLKASAPARVVNVSGSYHRKAIIDFDDLMCEKKYSALRANNQAKLAQILFTYELARRLEGTGVTVNCLHPGAVATDFAEKDPDLSPFLRLVYKVIKLFFASPEKGAETSIYLASSPEVEGVTAKYYDQMKQAPSSPESYDAAVAKRLWQVSAELTGLNP